MEQTDPRRQCTSARLAFADHVNYLVAGQRAPGSPKRTETLAGVNPPLDGSVVLLQDIVQVLHGPMPTLTAKCPFLLHLWDGGAVDRCQVRIDDAWLRMPRIFQSLTKQAFSGVGVTQSTSAL